MKIGLLEDNPAILDYMTTALQMAGYSVESHTASASLLDSLLTGEDLANPLPTRWLSSIYCCLGTCRALQQLNIFTSSFHQRGSPSSSFQPAARLNWNR